MFSKANSNFNCKKLQEIASGIRRDGFEQIESSDVQESLESQDEDLTETDLEEMLNSQPIEEEASTSTGNVTFNLKNLREGLRMANELCDFFMKIDPSMEQSLIFKKQIVNATVEYQSELKELLKTAKQEKITKFFKPLPKPEDNKYVINQYVWSKTSSKLIFYVNICFFISSPRHVSPI